MSKNVRWEVRYISIQNDNRLTVHCRETREKARRLMGLLKRHPDVAGNVRMYRVSEFLDDKGDPVMTFHKRAR